MFWIGIRRSSAAIFEFTSIAGILVRALVDFENRARLRRVVDHHSDLGDLGRGIDREFLLLQKAGLKRILHELARPDSVDVLARSRCRGSSARCRC